MTAKPGIACFLAGLLFVRGAWANEWSVDLDASSIGFIATYDEIPFEGRFGRFSAQIRFDPETPEEAHIEVTVDITSVDSNSPDRDAGMLETEWFDAARYPKASFSSSRFERLARKDEYSVTGDLTIKGASRPITAEFVWMQAGSTARLNGSADAKRGDFQIGSGDWAEDDTIGFDVRIIFDLALTI